VENLAVQVLCEREPELDAEALAARVRETLPGTVAVGDRDKPLLAHEDYPQEFSDGTKAILTLVARQDPDAEIGPLDLSQSWAFPDAEAVVARASTALLVAEMLGRGAPARDRVTAFKATLAAVVEQTRPLAVWSPSAVELVSPERVSEHPLSCLVNVRLFRVEDEEGVCVLDTIGLHALALPDFQLHFRGLEPDELAGHLRNLAAYAFEHEGEIESGHTVSGPGGEGRWTLRIEDSLVDPDRVVFDVDPGPPYAAGRRG
jgi:hypothetical protein